MILKALLQNCGGVQTTDKHRNRSNFWDDFLQS